MKFKRNLLILSAILIGVLIVVIGCLPPPTTPPAEGDVPTNGTISIAAAAVTTNDTTPSLTLSSTGATYMAFSGNGTTWSSWVTYATTYSAFNITTGVGCTSGDGTKTVYVKFKNDDGESTKVHDSIILDTVKPTLLTAVYTDVGSGGTVNKSDTIVFTFDDEMDITTVTASTVKANLLLSGSKSYGTSPTVSWDSTLKICTVTLGTSPTLVVGTTTVNPSVLVKDTAGNADASIAVTITGTTTAATVPSAIVLARGSATPVGGVTNVAIPVAGATDTTGAVTGWVTLTHDMIKFTVTDAGSAASTITIGGVAYTSGENYTIPSTANLTIIVTTTETGKTTCVRTFTVTVAAPAASTSPDPAKLSINASAGASSFKATYTDVPEGATVRVYSHASNSPTDAVTEGVIAAITISNDPTACNEITDGHYIFFKIFYSNTSISATTADGTMPSKPNTDALDAIQATSKNTVTSVAGGTVDPDDKITLYVSTTKYSYPTTVGDTMTSTIDLVAGNAPTYTRTNAAGHESVVSSSADGVILILDTAIAANGSGTEDSLDRYDTITLSFTDGSSSDQDVRVLLPITLSEHLTWTPTSGDDASLGTGPLALKTTAAVDSVVLTATSSAKDFADSSIDIAFNILPGIPIVDSAGGNYVLPWASDSDECFDSGDF